MANVNQATRFTGGVNERVSIVAGGAAGNITVAGIATVDRLKAVYSLIANSSGHMTAADLTDEFAITAANTINNTGGTASTNAVLIVHWVDVDYL